jgi:sugar-phosphatase
MLENEKRNRTLIFDINGVLIDSEPLCRRAEIEIFREVGFTLVDADCYQIQGYRIDEAVAFWFEQAPWSRRSCDDVEESIVARMAELNPILHKAVQ